MICSNCKRRLKDDAVNCLCGWSAEGKREILPCAYAPCAKNAVCRIFTKHGWANVCIDHYATAEFKRPITNSPVVKEVLAAYHASQYYRDRHLREPGSDDV